MIKIALTYLLLNLTSFPPLTLYVFYLYFLLYLYICQKSTFIILALSIIFIFLSGHEPAATSRGMKDVYKQEVYNLQVALEVRIGRLFRRKWRPSGTLTEVGFESAAEPGGSRSVSNYSWTGSHPWGVSPQFFVNRSQSTRCESSVHRCFMLWSSMT